MARTTQRGPIVCYPIQTSYSTAFTPGQRVKLDSAGTLVHCGAGDRGIGSVSDNYNATRSDTSASNAPVPVIVDRMVGTNWGIASAAITAGALVYGAASGKLSSTASGPVVGRALQAASGNGSEFEFAPAESTPFNTAIGDVDSTAKDALGALRFENQKWYKYVKVANVTATVAGAVGDPVSYKATYDGSTCVIDQSDAETITVCAGFLTGAVTGTAGTAYYTWVQLTGIVTVPTAITGGAIGKTCYCAAGTTDKTLLVGAAAYNQIVGTELDASGANNRILACLPVG